MEHRISSGILKRLAFGACAGLLGLSNAMGAGPASRPERVHVGDDKAPGVRVMTEPLAADLEKEIADRLVQRAAISDAGALARLDLEVDLRLLTRQMFDACSTAKADADAQAAAFARAVQLRQVTADVENLLNQQPAKEKMQFQAMAQLHQLTFKPAEVSGGDDDQCRTVAQMLLKIVGAKVDPAAALVLMRPAMAAQPASRPAQGPQTLAQLTDEIAQLTVSPALRQQLLSMTRRVGEINGIEGDDAVKVLLEALEIARGLQSNTAVSDESREEMSNQLSQGLALYGDPRFRSIGAEKISSLGDYRRLVTRIGSMNLSFDERRDLAPLLAYAQAHPDQSNKTLDVAGAYVQAQARLAALTAPPPATFKKPADDARRMYEQSRASAVEAISLPSVDPQGAAGHVDEMSRDVSLLELFERLPATVQTLSAYKPKPYGALDRRVSMLATTATGGGKSPARIEAQKSLEAIVNLATLADWPELSQTGSGKSDEIPADVLKEYAGGSLLSFESRARGFISELATQAAAGDMEAGKLTRLKRGRELLDSLHEAAAFEAALPNAEKLQRWADWQINIEDLTSLSEMYQQLSTAAFSAFASDGSADAMDQWLQERRRIGPLMALVVRDAAYADAVSQLPGGMQANLAKLATPLNVPIFSLERFAGMEMTLRTSLVTTGDTRGGDAVGDVLGRKLAAELDWPGAKQK